MKCICGEDMEPCDDSYICGFCGHVDKGQSTKEEEQCQECGERMVDPVINEDGMVVCDKCGVAGDQLIDYTDGMNYVDKDDGSHKDNRQTHTLDHWVGDIVIPGKILPNYCLGTRLTNCNTIKSKRLADRHKYLYTNCYAETAQRFTFYKFMERASLYDVPNCAVRTAIGLYSQIYNYTYTCGNKLYKQNLCKVHHKKYLESKTKCLDYTEETEQVLELKKKINKLMNKFESAANEKKKEDLQERLTVLEFELHDLRQCENHRIFKIMNKLEALAKGPVTEYCMYTEKFITRNKNKVAIEAACMYKACERTGYVRSINEIAEMWSTTPKIVTMGTKHFEKFFSTGKRATDEAITRREPTDYIHGWIDSIKNPHPDYRKTCVNLLKLLCNSPLYQEHTPEILAAGCMYYTHVVLLDKTLDEKETKRLNAEYKGKLHKLCDVSPARLETLRQRIDAYLKVLREKK